MSNNNKMKGLLKGLRYISQIFDQDEEKEPEMEIGFPTDVKHVAHIGWDGPSSSAGSPSWMNGFKGAPGSSSAPLSANNRGTEEEDPSVKCVSEDHGGRSPTGSATPNSPKRAPANAARDLPELPKSSRRHLSAGASGSECPTKAKSDKHKQARRSSRGATKDLPDGALKPTRHHHKDPSQEGESPSNLPEIPKKTRRKKSKDSSNNGGGSTSKSSRSRAQAQEVDGGSESGSVTNRDRSSHPSVLSAEENELI